MHRHEIIDECILETLESMYRDSGAGKPPKAVGMMALISCLQGYHKVSDAEAVELSVVDLRWQMVLGVLGTTKPPFSQGALFDFRERLIAHDMDQKLLERTAEIARASGDFDARKLPRTLRVAIDSSPLQGAGRVEDTLNLIGHAARKVVVCAAQLLDRDFADVCRSADIPILLEKSVKKALDRDWSDSRQKGEAIEVLAKQVLSLERWLDRNLKEQVEKPPLKKLITVLDKLIIQDLEPDPDGGGEVRVARQVAPDRRVSVEDGEMRHGRKTTTKRFNGYKRHVATDLDSDAILACAITSANRPEHEAMSPLKEDVESQDLDFGSLHIDRGYMGSPTVTDLQQAGAEIICKPWKTQKNGLFGKDEFKMNLRDMTLACPAGSVVSIELGKVVEYPSSGCDYCPLRSQCTTARKGHGRTVTINEDERLQERLRRMEKGKAGRERFRQRVAVEHRLAHVGYRQGPRARYRGLRKNLFDLRRVASIQNLETAQRKAA